MTDRELMQMALDALEAGVKISPNSELHERFRARLAQPEPEPVAYWDEKAEVFCMPPKDGGRPFVKEWKPLYPAQPQREWQGLTYEEQEKLVEASYSIRDAINRTDWKMREKNGF